MAYIYSLADTWADGATTFTAIKMSVTDTASAAGSLLMDLQVGGSSKFVVDKAGDITLAGTKISNVSTTITTAIFYGTSAVRAGTLYLGSGFANILNISSGRAVLQIGDSNIFEQRNGVNAQAFNLYNTYTDASNYERGFMRFVSNTLRIGTEKLGTGTGRNLEFQVDGTTRMSINTGGAVVANIAFYGATGSTYFGWTNNALMTSPSSGVIRLNNFAETDFNRVQFGGTTSSFPAIKRSTTSLQARLADDSAFTNIQGKLTTEANAVAETITATHTLTLYDAAGTAYKVPCVAV